MARYVIQEDRKSLWEFGAAEFVDNVIVIYGEHYPIGTAKYRWEEIRSLQTMADGMHTEGDDDRKPTDEVGRRVVNTNVNVLGEWVNRSNPIVN